MRNLLDLSEYRRVDLEFAHYGMAGDGEAGMFCVPSCTDRQPLRIVASAGGGWDHVSVSHPRRIPNYLEMDHVKRLFFRPDECAMQLHVEEAAHVNNHARCLHLWRPQHEPIPRPPAIFVGVQGVTPEQIAEF